jgi:O-antigen/teichoic acid export membrane protein
LENAIIGRILRQLSRNQRFIYELGSSYALLGLNMVTMFVLTPALVRNLGKESYGIWLVLFGITNFFNLSSFGFGQTFIIELIKKQDKLKEVNKLVNTFLFSMFLFGLGTFPIFLLIQFFLLGPIIKISSELLPEASKSFWLIYLVFFLNFISQLPFNILFARHKLSLRNGLEMFRIASVFLASIYVLKTGGGLLQLSSVTLLSTIVYTIALFVVSKYQMVYDLHYSHFSNKQFRRFLKPSFHFFLMGLAQQIIVHSYSILVSSLQNASLVVMYSVALRIPDTSMRLIFKFSDVKVPKITSLYHQRDWVGLWLLHNRLLWLTLGLAAIGALGLVFFGPWIIDLWMGKDFGLNYFLLVVFTINMFALCVIHIPSVFLQSMGIHERSSIISMIGAPISIVAAWYFSKLYGLEGIAVALCGIQLLVQILIIPEFYSLVKNGLKEKNININPFLIR